MCVCVTSVLAWYEFVLPFLSQERTARFHAGVGLGQAMLASYDVNLFLDDFVLFENFASSHLDSFFFFPSSSCKMKKPRSFGGFAWSEDYIYAVGQCSFSFSFPPLSRMQTIFFLLLLQTIQEDTMGSRWIVLSDS